MKEISIAITISENKEYTILPAEITDTTYPHGVVRVYNLWHTPEGSPACRKAFDSWMVANMIDPKTLVGAAKCEAAFRQTWVEFGYLGFRVKNPGYWMHDSQFLPVSEFIQLIKNP